MPRLSCWSCGRQIYTVAPLEALFAEERRCPRCGAFLREERRETERRTHHRRTNPTHDPGPPRPTPAPDAPDARAASGNGRKKKGADKVLKTCEEKPEGLFTRICLETEEGPNHILYSLFWMTSGTDIAVVTIAGTSKELWETYAPTFDKMGAFELIDMKRFEK